MSTPSALVAVDWDWVDDVLPDVADAELCGRCTDRGTRDSCVLALPWLHTTDDITTVTQVTDVCLVFKTRVIWKITSYSWSKKQQHQILGYPRNNLLKVIPALSAV